jgi:hypothetical protein
VLAWHFAPFDFPCRAARTHLSDDGLTSVTEERDRARVSRGTGANGQEREAVEHVSIARVRTVGALGDTAAMARSIESPGRRGRERPHLPADPTGRYVIFQMAEAPVPRELFGHLLDRIEAASTRPGPMLTLDEHGGEASGVEMRPVCVYGLPKSAGMLSAGCPDARRERRDRPFSRLGGGRPLPSKPRWPYSGLETGWAPSILY